MMFIILQQNEMWDKHAHGCRERASELIHPVRSGSEKYYFCSLNTCVDVKKVTCQKTYLQMISKISKFQISGSEMLISLIGSQYLKIRNILFHWLSNCSLWLVRDQTGRSHSISFSKPVIF